MTPAITTTQPTPQAIEKMAADYEAKLEAVEAAEKAADECAKPLLALVQKFGDIPNGASQSKRLLGIQREVTATFGMTRTLLVPRVITFRAFMKSRSVTWLFKKMFEESTKYTMRKGARETLAAAPNLPPATREKALALFGLCVDMKTQKPKLTVKAVKPELPKKPRVSATKGKAVA